jgi:N-acyl-D-amino-acid deacylase
MKKLIKTARTFGALSLLTVLLPSCLNRQEQQTYDLLLEQATIVDGTGKAPYVANLLVNGDSIAFIGTDTTASYIANRKINARGLILTPGFIDTHAHGNPMETPEFRNFLAMGVTTLCLGQDGFSPEQEDIRLWMDSVNAVRPAVNVALFVGHSTLRLLSGAQYDSIPSDEDLTAMEKLLADALEAGCFGMTTGLEYTPGYYASSAELNRLAKVVGANNGLLMSHMRNEDDQFVESSIRELLAQGKYCPVHVSHIKVVYGKGEKRAEEILQLLDSARTSGIEVTADFYPYTASYTGIEILFPEWAKKPYDYQEVLKSRKTELATYLRNRVLRRNGPEATLIGSGPFAGKTLAQISEELKKPFEEALMEDIGPYGASGAYFIMDEPLQEALLKDPHVMICTDGGPTMSHPRSSGAFAKIIETYVVEKKMLQLPEAIRKMSGLPAQTLGIKKRGLIMQGYKADIILFDPREVRENATYEEPFQLASGFRYVFVNGQLVKEGQDFQENRYGEMLVKPTR